MAQPVGSSRRREADYLQPYQHSTVPNRYSRSSGWEMVVDFRGLPETVLRRDEWYNDYLLRAGIDDALSADFARVRHT